MNAQVLIVGAGPAGLMAACELARRGVGFRIVDKKAAPTTLTNAAAVHTRTLEIFGHLGIADRLLAQGQKWTKMTVRSGRDASLHIPLGQVDSCYGGSLLVPQSVTEAVLVERLAELGGQVDWLTEVLDIDQSDNVRVRLLDSRGQNRQEEYAWLIACDGLHSLVRQKVGIAVEGEDIESPYVVCDVGITTAADPREVVAYAGDGSILGLFPLGQGTYRVIGNLVEMDAKNAVSEPQIRQLIESRTYGSFLVDSVMWSSPFWIHSKVAAHLRRGRVFLAGDAAHVHSPAGGQGMNTGIQDVYNLIWKLALVIDGKASQALLDSYETERMPVIRSIVRGTEAVTKMALSKSRVRRFLRVLVINWLGRQPRILEKIANRLTQLSLGYRNSPLLLSKRNAGQLRPGDRAPDLLWNGRRLYETLGDRVHTVLVFAGHGVNSKLGDPGPALERRLGERFANLVCVLRVGTDDSGTPLHRRYGLPLGGVAVIRPDQYLSFLSRRWSASQIERVLEVALGQS